MGKSVGERLARHGHAQHRRGDRAHQLGREVDGLRVEGGVALGRRPERVEPRRQVAVHAVRLHQRGGGLDGLQKSLVWRASERGRDQGRRGLRGRDRPGAVALRGVEGNL